MGIITTFGQYQRVERLAGGVASSDRAFLRAARLLLSKDGVDVCRVTFPRPGFVRVRGQTRKVRAH